MASAFSSNISQNNKRYGNVKAKDILHSLQKFDIKGSLSVLNFFRVNRANFESLNEPVVKYNRIVDLLLSTYEGRDCMKYQKEQQFATARGMLPRKTFSNLNCSSLDIPAPATWSCQIIRLSLLKGI